MAKKNKHKQKTSVRIICWGVIPLILGVILVLDYLQIYTFTAERKMLVVLLVATILIPVTGEIKIGDLSINSENRK